MQKWGIPVLTGFLVSTVLAACSGTTPTGTTPSQTPPASSSSGSQKQPAASETPDVLRIGHLDPMTGAAAVYGIPQSNAIKMVVQQVNDQGGLQIGDQKYKIELISYDTGGAPANAVAAVNRLIDQDKVSFIIGDLISSSVLSWTPVIANHGGKVLALNPGASSGAITAASEYIFQTKPTTDSFAPAVGTFVAQDLGAKKVALMVQQDDYGKELQQFITQEVEKAGGQVVASEAYGGSDSDFYTQLTTIKNLAPDAIVSAGYATPTNYMLKQAKELGLGDLTLAGATGTPEADALAQVGPDALEGTYDIRPAGMEELILTKHQPALNFDAAYRKAHDKPASQLGGMGWDGMWTLVRAFEKAGSTEVDAVRKALLELTPDDVPELVFPRVAQENGKLFNAKRQVMVRTSVVKWVGGKMAFKKWLN